MKLGKIFKKLLRRHVDCEKPEIKVRQIDQVLAEVQTALSGEVASLYADGDGTTRPHTEQARTLPVGWIWVMYPDGSGHIQDPEGNEIYSYDLATGEYRDEVLSQWHFHEDYPGPMRLEEFQEFAEREVKRKYLGKPYPVPEKHTCTECAEVRKVSSPEGLYCCATDCMCIFENEPVQCSHFRARL